MRKSIISMFAGLAIACLTSTTFASDNEVIGEVDVGFKMFGPNNKIMVTAFDDPKVKGISCYLSSLKIGGIDSTIGLNSYSSDTSVACRKTGKIDFPQNIANGEEVFTAKRSLIFKELHVVRFIDRERKMLIYLTYSDHLIDGSPKNAVTAVSYGNTESE